MPVMDTRRISGVSGRSREELTMYSPQSVLHAMDRFQSAVGSMENSVLVPCRLQDIPDPVMGDLLGAFKLLSRTKVDLLFGDENSQQNSKPASSRRSTFVDHPSNGYANNGSSSTSNGHSEFAEQDKAVAGVLPDGAAVALDPAMLKLHANLNQNLKNLYAILEQMTDAANRVTNMYLKEVGGDH